MKVFALAVLLAMVNAGVQVGPQPYPPGYYYYNDGWYGPGYYYGAYYSGPGYYYYYNGPYVYGGYTYYGHRHRHHHDGRRHH